MLAWVLSGPAPEYSTHPLRQGSLDPQVKRPHVAFSTEVRPVLLLLTKALSRPSRLDFEPSGEDASQDRPPRPSFDSVPHPFGHSPTSSFLRRWVLLLRLERFLLDFEAALGFSAIHSVMFSGSAILSLRHCRQRLKSSPFLSLYSRWRLAPGSCRCHRPTVIREPCRTCQSTHVARSIAVDFRDLRVTAVHSASLYVSRSPGGELIR